MSIHKFFLYDFVEIQRKSFFELLKKGLIDEISKRNPIVNIKRDLELFFYPEHYRLTFPQTNPQNAILKGLSYTAKLYVPIQLTNKNTKIVSLKWAYIGNLPLMTKRGHFILNGTARVIVNQILRSPGIYYQQKLYEVAAVSPPLSLSLKGETSPLQGALPFIAGKGSPMGNQEDNLGLKPLEKQFNYQKFETNIKRYYADLICSRGTWLRLEIDKDKNIWVQTKKGPKIPVLWFLIAMGLTYRIIFKSIIEPNRLVQNLENKEGLALENSLRPQPQTTNTNSLLLPFSSSEKSYTVMDMEVPHNQIFPKKREQKAGGAPLNLEKKKIQKQTYAFVKNPPDAWKEIYSLTFAKKLVGEGPHPLSPSETPLTWGTSPTLTSSTSFGSKGLSENNFSLGVGAKPLETKKDVVPLSQKGRVKEGPLPLGSNKALGSGPDGLWGERKRTPHNNPQLHSKVVSQEVLMPSGEASESKTNAYYGASPHNPALWTKNLSEKGRKWFYNKFLNPRYYDLGKQGRLALNQKLNLTVSLKHCTLTSQDLLYATNYLIKVEKGYKTIDDIDHLKNKRVRTSGELIQIQLGTGLIRLEKTVRERMNFAHSEKSKNFLMEESQGHVLYQGGNKAPPRLSVPSRRGDLLQSKGSKDKVFQGVGQFQNSVQLRCLPLWGKPHNNTQPLTFALPVSKNILKLNNTLNLINSKAFNSALREFFGTSQLSQFMDQINPLAEITHKRRLSSMGPGGITRDTATLAIRGIHPTHYGRICPVETPEGKNTGLVNSITTYAKINKNGLMESPFFKVFKGQVQKKTGMYFLSAEHEEKMKLGAADLFVSSIGFLTKSKIPVRIADAFTKVGRNEVQFLGVSSFQMISIATSLIPFLEHNDANRALMGSNMQRQAVPLLRSERPIVGTGLEARTISDSGNVLQSKFSGLVTYVSSEKILITTF